MAAVVTMESVVERAEDRKHEAKKYFNAILKAGGMVSSMSLRIGWNAYQLKKKNLFVMLGFETEAEAARAAGVGESTWFAQIRVAEAFDGMDEDLFCSMKSANAKALADLPESKRFDSVWIRRAGVDKIEEFAEAIDRELDGKARASDGKERSVALKLTMPTSRKKAVESGLKEYAKEIGAKDEGEALEKMVAEHTTGSVSLLTAITHAIERIGAAKGYGESGMSAGEALEKVYGELDAIVEEFRNAVTALQNLESEKE